jgi:hypothetical protein
MRRIKRKKIWQTRYYMALASMFTPFDSTTIDKCFNKLEKELEKFRNKE